MSAVTAFHDLEAVTGEIAGAFPGGTGVDVVETQPVDAEHGLEGQRLEFRLRAVADHGHRRGPLRREIFGGHGRRRRRAQRREDRHLRDQGRIAARSVGQHAEGGDRLAPSAGIIGMTVDIFEAIERAVAGRHQLDDAGFRMGADPRRLVEQFPAPEILLDIAHQFDHELLDAGPHHELHHVIDADEGDDVEIGDHA